jgi:steroid 5-alpha reductase family enzyme
VDILMELYLFVLGLTLLAVFIYMNGWFIKSALKNRNDIADQAWGMGFVMISLLTLALNQATGSYLIVLALVSIWGFRLFWHIYKRQRASGENQRYQELVDKNKSRFVESYLKVFMLQGIFMFIISLPIINFGFYNGSFKDLVFVNWLGLAVWVIGFFFESVGDYQLKMFLSKPENKGKIMMDGLWRYTRHPNYFGEITMWWGIFLVTYQGVSTNLWLASAVGPLLISYLLIFVSGIPMAEKRQRMREDYRQYMKTTSALVPWFKKQ